MCKIHNTYKEGKNKYSVTYADGTKQEILKTVKVSEEVSMARHALAAYLQDTAGIEYFKSLGYQTSTINTLSRKLKEWCVAENESKHESIKLQLSGKVKELYKEAMKEVIKDAQEDLEII